MRQTAVEWLEKRFYFTKGQLIDIDFEQAKAMEKEQKKDAYQHGRDDENCALSDGAMAPDYDNADEWYKGEYGGEK
jgi:hypothetical protein